MLHFEPMAMQDRLSVAVKDLTGKSDNNPFTSTAKPFIFLSVIKK